MNSALQGELLPPKPPCVLVVDDIPENIDILSEILEQHYEVRVALSGEKALEIASSGNPPDLVLLDINMPGMDGYEVCRQLKANAATRPIPVLFVTAARDVESEAKGFAVGCLDYITKPISPPIVLARVKTQLSLFDQNRVLKQEVYKRTLELSRFQDITIQSLASLAEMRDNETGEHIIRTQNYVLLLAEWLLEKGKYREVLDSNLIELMYKSAPLHDIGKVAIPDFILFKPEKLTESEFELMKRHVEFGGEAIALAERRAGSNEFFRVTKELILNHHEHWDGSGYPKGLRGEEIPLSGRIMSLADVYDALISRRTYKPPYSHETARAIIVKSTLFDPQIVDAFLQTQDLFKKIALSNMSSEADRVCFTAPYDESAS